MVYDIKHNSQRFQPYNAMLILIRSLENEVTSRISSFWKKRMLTAKLTAEMNIT